MKSSRQLWIFYTIAWLLYAASLGTVFAFSNFALDYTILTNILGNVLPPYLMGFGIIRLCRKLKWSERRNVSFYAFHLIVLIAYPILWVFSTLSNLSLTSYFRTGNFVFARWDGYAWQWQIFTGLMAYLTIASVVYVVEVNENLQLETKQNAELKLLAVQSEAARNQAELFALRSQLNPHFLFNTLHSVMALVRTDTRKAEQAIEQFAAMLRYVLQSQEGQKAEIRDVSFADEWHFTKNYLEMEKIRLGERLQISVQIEDAAMSCFLPAFTLQPILENAVKHAVSPRTRGGKICLQADAKNSKLIINISDDGRGVAPEKLANTQGLGLRLVKQSLAARFGNEAKFQVSTEENRGFTVSIEIPKVVITADENSSLNH